MVVWPHLQECWCWRQQWASQFICNSEDPQIHQPNVLRTRSVPAALSQHTAWWCEFMSRIPNLMNPGLCLWQQFRTHINGGLAPFSSGIFTQLWQHKQGFIAARRRELNGALWSIFLERIPTDTSPWSTWLYAEINRNVYLFLNTEATLLGVREFKSKGHLSILVS